MSHTINGLRLRSTFGRADWLVPDPFGPDGWRMIRRDGTGSVIVTAFPHHDGTEWIHASIAGDDMPTYDDLCTLHAAVWGTTGWSYQAFAPSSDHVNIHQHALHLWGRADGHAVMPNFGKAGTI